jgi:hypothetical protein
VTAVTSGTDVFVVRPDVRAARRMQVIFCAAAALLITGNAMALTDEEGWGLVVRLVSIVAWIVLLATQLVIWQRLAAAGTLAEIGPDGLRVHVLGTGAVRVPWAATASVRTDWAGRVWVRLADGIDRDTPGTEWPPETAGTRRARRRGLVIPTRQADAAPNQVVAALRHFSGGRL